MDVEPDLKRPRLSNPASPWSNGPHHNNVLPHPAPPPPPSSHHPTQPGQYQPHFPRPSDPPPPPPPSSAAPYSQQQQQHRYDDRRHHEPPEPVSSMPDHRQLPPSPAHPPAFSPYGREPVPLKRENTDDQQPPHLRRPPSNGNPEPPLHAPQSSHGPPPQQPPPHYEDRKYMTYDNGPAPPSGPAGVPLYRNPSYPPPTPTHSQPHYHEQHSMYQSPGPDAMYAIPFTSSSKRKAQRASQACDSCRSLKAKCDETKPCKNCREKGMECKYRDPIPKQQDKVTADILDSVNLLRAEVNQQVSQLHMFNSELLTKLSAALKQINPSVDLDTNIAPPVFQSIPSPIHQVDEVYASPDDVATLPDDPRRPSSTQNSAHPISSYDAMEIARAMNKEEGEVDDEPGPPVLPDEPAMPINHTTIAGLLLQWDSIRHNVQDLLDQEGIKYLSEYPIRQEESRGLIRLFGRGEGHDKTVQPGRESVATEGGHSGTQSEHMDDASDVASPSPGEAWGQVGGLSPPSTLDLRNSPLRPNGDLDLSPEVVWKYVAAYEEHIQNMHPLIIPKELQALVKIFLDRIPPHTKKTAAQVAIAKFTYPSDAGPEPSLKRKRSPVADYSEPIYPQKPGKPFRSIDDALVLVVLALGKICSYRHDRLPDVVPEVEPLPQPSPQLRNGHPSSPNQGSPPSHSMPPQATGIPSPRVDDRGLPSRRASFQGVTSAGGKPFTYMAKRNLDNIPGLEYFALATDIIGNHIGAKSLKMIWVSILSGLYYGQLGRPIQSLEHIAMGGRTLLSLLRPHMNRMWEMKLKATEQNRKIVLSKRDNQLIFAFWSCLQLESDILAELQLPPSGVLSYEKQIPYPDYDMAAKQGFDNKVLKSYYGQLYLRNHLNSMHRELYDAHRPWHSPPLEVIKALSLTLKKDSKVSWLPVELHFDESDPLATTMLGARLRAKYWGARVILYRQCVRQVLETNFKRAYMDASAHGPDAPQLGMDAISPESVEFAKLGIHALVESTRSFHNLKDKRFVITNPFGTAHAQWGNLLILYAAHRDPILGPLIHEDMLRDLFRRTIDFFNVVVQATSSLKHDLHILEGLQRKIERGEHRRAFPGTHSYHAVINSANGPSMPSPNTPSDHSGGPYSMAPPSQLGMSPSHAHSPNQHQQPPHHLPHHFQPIASPHGSSPHMSPRPVGR